jgi:hypothetical protein
MTQFAIDRAGLTLVPREQFPFDYNSYGPGSTRDTNIDRTVARLEQRVADAFSFELAYNREFTSQLVHTVQGNQVQLGGDPNTVIPNPNGSATPIANPRAGDLFVEGRWVGDRGETRNEVFRTSAAWDVNLGKFGRHKLSPRISPNKTVEGLVGGAVTAVLVAMIGAPLAGATLGQLPAVALVVLVTVGFSVVGDLFESLLKRHVGAKDSGDLIPGHGGILDRIDSVVAALPVFALGKEWLGF